MFTGGQSRFGVGRKNIAMAQDILKSHNLRPIVCDTGGLQGRKLTFHTGSGRVKMDLLTRQGNQSLPRVQDQKRILRGESLPRSVSRVVD